MQYKQIQDARYYVAWVSHKMARDAFQPNYGFASHVTDRDKVEYIRRRVQNFKDIVRGKLDNNFSIQQKVHYYITEESIPLL